MAGRPLDVVLALVLFGCSSPESAPEAPSDWAVERDDLNRAVDARAAWAAANPAAWTRTAALAETLAQRARHTGDLDDFAAAEVALDTAFSHAKAGSGPVIERARLDLSLHRFDAAIAGAEQVLGGAIVPEKRRAEALSVIGRSALELGEVQRAGEALVEAAALDPNPATLSDLAVFYGKVGQAERSDALWDKAREACGCPGERFDAWVSLQRGLVPLDAGDPAAALAHFEDAEVRYTGDWVFAEHRAEALASLGRLAEADAVYADAIATVRDPEVLAAWAGVRRELGDAERADALVAEARAGFDRARERFPEAMSGHAAAFFAD